MYFKSHFWHYYNKIRVDVRIGYDPWYSWTTQSTCASVSIRDKLQRPLIKTKVCGSNLYLVSPVICNWRNFIFLTEIMYCFNTHTQVLFLGPLSMMRYEDFADILSGKIWVCSWTKFSL